MLLRLELVGPEDLEATLGLFIVETLRGALKELEHVLDNDCLEVDLVLVVQILRLQLDLQAAGKLEYGNRAG